MLLAAAPAAASPVADEARRKIAEKRYEWAAGLLKLPADMGDSDAQEVLAGLYERGEGVPQDAEAAKRLYERCARQGRASCAKALERLGAPGPAAAEAAVKAAQAALTAAVDQLRPSVVTTVSTAPRRDDATPWRALPDRRSLGPEKPAPKPARLSPWAHLLIGGVIGLCAAGLYFLLTA